jgi:regulator of protease activity HflC (stomatin/prohibitin superfamily)
MDTEVRGRIQQSAAEVAARYRLDDLRGRKQEIMDAVRSDAGQFFSLRGISITTVGMFGGMTYENPEIQKAIDKTFIAQQEKVVNQARFDAQQRENDRVELEAQALAEKVRRAAQGEADAKRLIASAEAESIRDVNKALTESQQNPLILQFKQFDVEKARIEKWSGNYPQYFLAPSEKSGLLVQLPQIK